MTPAQTLVVSGVSHALNLHPEAPDTELVRLSSASRALEPVATITQRGSVKHGLADLEKAGQRARENREQAEKEKEGRRCVVASRASWVDSGLNSLCHSAVLLDSAPSTTKNRSASHSRLLASTSSRPHTPIPSSAPGSRTASPSSTPRQPSRLTAVPPKPPHPPGPAPSSTFRIGKGSVPNSIALSRSSSSSSSGASVSLASIVNGTAPSPPDPAASSASTAVPPPAEPQRQASTSSTASSSSSEVSLLQKTIASGASATSPESLPLAETAAKVDKGKAVAVAEELMAKGEEKPAAPVRAGGGGVLKGKESLKKEKRREERAKDRTSAGADSAVAASMSAPAKRDSAGAKARAEEDSEDEVERRDKKKRRLLDDEDVGTSSSRASSVARSVKGAKNGRDKQASERGSDREWIDAKKIIKERRRQRDESPPPKGGSSNGAKKKKRQRVVTERWYSSSSEEESARPLARKNSQDGVKPRASSTSTPLTNASPLRQVTTLPGPTRKPPPVPSLPPVTVTSAASFASSRLSFLETYASYAVLHSKLLDERCRLEQGTGGALGGPDQVLKLVEQVGRKQAELEALKEGMRIWSAEQKRRARS